jgi:endonuclease III
MKQKTIIKIIKVLNKLYGFRYQKQKPFKVLIGVVLSQRTNDDISFPATYRLIKKAKILMEY